jgi:Uma2 family endonuclease
MSALLARRYLFDVDTYEQMVETGVLTANDKVELIEGEIIKKMPLGSRHAARVDRGTRVFSRQAAEFAIVRVQSPIRLDRSEPEPDISLLRLRDDFYESGHPHPEDVLLIVEVADSTVRSDRAAKIPIYARNGIAEVWLLDVERNRLEIYTHPINGEYQNVRLVRRDETITLQLLPEVTINAADLL